MNKKTNEITLSEEQESLIIECWNFNKSNPPSIKELCQLLWPDGIDGRVIDGKSKEGRAIKKFLASREIKAHTSRDYQKKEELILTENQELYIKNHYTTNSTRDMARAIFDDSSLTPLSHECRKVCSYVATLEEEGFSEKEDNALVFEDWAYPKSVTQAVARVNKIVNIGWNYQNLKNFEKRCITELMRYLKTYSLNSQLNNYVSNADRRLFESSFVENTYNKPDLEQEEITQYIYLAQEEVTASSLRRRSEALQVKLDESIEMTGGKINMPLVEAIDKITKEYNQCCARKNTLLNSLVQKRSKRMDSLKDRHITILDLVAAWRDPETRKEMLELGEKETAETKEEVGRLRDADDLKAKILGLSEHEALYG